MTWANGQHSIECGSWLKERSHDFYPFPSSNNYYMNALRLLMSAPDGEQPFYCPCVSAINIRQDPWHCIDCPHVHHVRSKCHTKILDALQLALESVGDVKGSPRLIKDGNAIYADLQFCRSSDSRIFNIDAASVNPTAAKYMVTTSLPPPDRATSLIELEKRSFYKGVDSHPQNQFVPFVVECTGKLGKSARDFLKEAGLDEKKRNALKNKIASIMAFANGECIATAFLRGSTRPMTIMDCTIDGDIPDGGKEGKLSFSQRSHGARSGKSYQRHPQVMESATSNTPGRKTTGGDRTSQMHTGGKSVITDQQQTSNAANSIPSDSQITGQITDKLPVHITAESAGLASSASVGDAPPDPDRMQPPVHPTTSNDNETCEETEIYPPTQTTTNGTCLETLPTKGDSANPASPPLQIEMTQLDSQLLTTPIGDTNNDRQTILQTYNHNQTQESSESMISRTMPTGGEILESCNPLQSVTYERGADDTIPPEIDSSLEEEGTLTPCTSPNPKYQSGGERGAMGGKQGNHPLV